MVSKITFERISYKLEENHENSKFKALRQIIA